MKTILLAAMLVSLPLSAQSDPPETVMVTYRPQAGKEKELEAILSDQRALLAKMNLTAPKTPHLLMRDGKAYVEVFTWKSHATPDNAPPELLAIWKRLNAAVEKTNGLEFHEVQPLAASCD